MACARHVAFALVGRQPVHAKMNRQPWTQSQLQLKRQASVRVIMVSATTWTHKASTSNSVWFRVILVDNRATLVMVGSVCRKYI
jgi:hypothetical protein